MYDTIVHLCISIANHIPIVIVFYHFYEGSRPFNMYVLITDVCTHLQDIIFGLSGGDIINGGKGSDLIYAGSGKDFVRGEEGADTIYGENG